MDQLRKIRPVYYEEDGIICPYCSHEFYGEIAQYPYMKGAEIYCPECRKGFKHELERKKFEEYLERLKPGYPEMIEEARRTGFERELELHQKDVSNLSMDEIEELSRRTRFKGEYIFYLMVFIVLLMIANYEENWNRLYYSFASLLLVICIPLGIFIGIRESRASRTLKDIHAYDIVHGENIFPKKCKKPLSDDVARRLGDEAKAKAVNIRLWKAILKPPDFPLSDSDLSTIIPSGDDYHEVKVDVNGEDGIGLNMGRVASIKCTGDAGVQFFGGNRGAVVRLTGNTGNSTGINMHSGTIVVYGNAAHYTGLRMLGGNIIIFGDAGEYTGEWMLAGAIFVAGKVASLGANAEYAEIPGSHEEMLRRFVKIEGMDHDGVSFRMIVRGPVRYYDDLPEHERRSMGLSS